ncbi:MULTISPECIES: hypothetical protein [unclassified Mycobacterium]|uniref:hypothetical protein n=1 Tax=unclassified Mycobacterium TaxID=2642494 RepID=UPI00048F8D9A|nr:MULTISPECIES: hypothetical protein [unclassified Mycobacterium]SEA04204.1 hypothetical protein SAMN04488580_101551 [Mycobacterium sp. 283mftsu]
MALAILRLDDSDETGLAFSADTGTSGYYRIHLGKEVRRDDGIDVIDGPYWSSPLQLNPRAGRHLDTRTTIRLPAGVVTERGTLAQLETCRGPDGRGPAFSRPVRVAVPVGAPARIGAPRLSAERVLTMSATSAMSARTAVLSRPRMVSVCSAEERFSRPASVADLIGAVTKAATPVVLDVINRAAQPDSSGTPGSNDVAGLAIPALLSDVLRSILGALAVPPGAAPPTTPGPAPVTQPPTPPAPPPAAAGVARPASTHIRAANRFFPDAYTRPMIFGVDDALLAAVAGPALSGIVGPLVQALPQLLNAANKQKLDRQAATDKHVTDLLSEVNRGMLMQQLISAQNQPVNPGIASSDLAAIGSLLQQLTTAPAPAGTPATAVSRPASTTDPTASLIASRAVLSAVTGPAVTLLGSPRVAFAHDQAITLRYRLDVGAGGPARAIPRAILTWCAREPGGATDLCWHTEKLSNVAPGTELKIALTPEESKALPADTDLEVLASLRWKGAKGTYQATCVHKLVLASRVQVRDRGDIIGNPVELTDMNRFRSFWNKVWDSPTNGAGTEALPLWGLDAALRYSVVAVGTAQGNGLMQTRVQQQPTDQGLRAQTKGRIKSGLEVSVTELNKLLPLWAGEQPLPDADLAAFTARNWLAGQGGDTVTQVRMAGKRGTRGVLWVVPVLKLRAFTLATAADTDPYGQLIGTQDRTVHFPVIESVRLVGLASLREGSEPGEAAEVDGAVYRFDGYDVVLQSLVGLEPAQPISRAKG